MKTGIPYPSDLTATEASRQWMTPAQVCALVGMGNPDAAFKRMLNNLTDRGHIPATKSGDARTSARLYSLTGATMLRVFIEMTSTGRTYQYTQPVADLAAQLILDQLPICEFDYDLERAVERKAIVYGGIKETGAAGFAALVDHEKAFDYAKSRFCFDFGIYDIGYHTFRIVDIYLDLWTSSVRAGR